MRTLIITILVLVMVRGTFAQKEGQQLVDSLSTELAVSKEDTNKVRLLATLSYEMSNINAEEGLKHGQEALKLAEKLNDLYGMGIAHLALDRCNYHLSRIPETIDHALKAKMIFESLDNEKKICEAHLSLSVVFFFIDPVVGRSHLQSASSLLQGPTDPAWKVKAMSRLGNLFRWYGEVDSSRKYLNLAIRLGVENRMNGEVNLAKSRLGWLFYDLNKWDSAYLYKLQAASYMKKAGQIKFWVEDQNFLANTRLNQIREDSSLRDKYLKEAETYALQGFETATKIGYKNEMLLASQALAEIYKQQGKFDLAFRFLDSAYTYNQVVYGSAEINKASILTWKYEQQLKEKEVELLKLRNRQQLTLTIVAFSSLAILILVVLFVIRSRRKLNKAYHLVSRQKERITEVLTELESTNLKLETSNLKLADANLELETSNLKLADANQELEAFSYSVSHDLRAPVRRIEGLCEMLSEDYENLLDDAGRDLLSRIAGSTALMNTLIDDMLKLSRITRQSVSKAPCDISEMAKNICKDVRQNYPGQEMTCMIQEGIIVEADAHLMQIALQNLIDNAFKYSSKVERPEVIVKCEMQDSEMQDGEPERSGARRSQMQDGKIQNGKMVISVRDNGVGFEMSQAGKLFTPFQRLHSDEEFKGTGIGLATVKRIIVKHGGTISVESEPGKGTTFSFTLA